MKRKTMLAEHATQRLHIGAFAEAASLSRDTVRFYEKAGLLKPQVLANGYRVFDEGHLDLVRSIRIAQLLGFTLAEIKAQMGQWETLSPAKRIHFMEEKLKVLDARVAELAQMRSYLEEKVAWMRSGRRGIPQRLQEAARGKRAPRR